MSGFLEQPATPVKLDKHPVCDPQQAGWAFNSDADILRVFTHYHRLKDPARTLQRYTNRCDVMSRSLTRGHSQTVVGGTRDSRMPMETDKDYSHKLLRVYKRENC